MFLLNSHLKHRLGAHSIQSIIFSQDGLSFSNTNQKLISQFGSSDAVKKWELPFKRSFHDELNGILPERTLLTENLKRVNKFVNRKWMNYVAEVSPHEGSPSPSLFEGSFNSSDRCRFFPILGNRFHIFNSRMGFLCLNKSCWIGSSLFYPFRLTCLSAIFITVARWTSCAWAISGCSLVSLSGSSVTICSAKIWTVLVLI